MRWSTCAPFCCLLVGASLLGAPSAWASFPGRNGELVYDSQDPVPDCEGGDCVRGRFFFLDTVHRKTEQFQGQCQGEICQDTRASWAPGGRTLIFDRFQRGSGRVILSTRGGTLLRTLGERAATVFSPGGDQLASAIGLEQRPGSRTGTDVIVTTLGGDRLRRLTFRGGDSPKWSVRGEIVFERNNKPFARSDLYVVRATGGPIRRLTYRHGANADWSPDGRRLAFSRDYRARSQRDRSEVVILNPRTGRTRRFTYRGGRLPVWSPDGKSIAFVRGSRIYIAPVDGRKPTRSFATRGSGIETLDWQALRGR